MRSVIAQPQLYLLAISSKTLILSVTHERPIPACRRHAAVDARVGRAHRPQEPQAGLERCTIQPDVDPSRIGNFNTIKKLGPARFVSRGMRVGSVDQVACHIDRRYLARTV